MATINPPPVSTSLGSVLTSHVHHATGAVAATNPQTPSNTVAADTESPNQMSAKAITAISSDMTVKEATSSNLYKAPAKPATSIRTGISEARCPA
jgi:hypothetical protein